MLSIARQAIAQQSAEMWRAGDVCTPDPIGLLNTQPAQQNGVNLVPRSHHAPSHKLYTCAAGPGFELSGHKIVGDGHPPISACSSFTCSSSTSGGFWPPRSKTPNRLNTYFASAALIILSSAQMALAQEAALLGAMVPPGASLELDKHGTCRVIANKGRQHARRMERGADGFPQQPGQHAEGRRYELRGTPFRALLR